MPLPAQARSLNEEATNVQALLEAVDTAVAALPATPLEADLPDIVAIVADLSSAAQDLRSIVDTMATILSTTRVNQ